MKKEMEIIIGGIYERDGFLIKVESFSVAENGKDYIVNGQFTKKRSLKPVRLSEELFEELGFQYYDGWIKGKLTVYRYNLDYVCSIAAYDFIIIQYAHELQVIMNLQFV